MGIWFTIQSSVVDTFSKFQLYQVNPIEFIFIYFDPVTYPSG